MTEQLSYFEVFSLPEDYAVDLQELQDRYQELQRSFHPDRFASADPVQKRVSVQYASLINDAYATLKSPVKRARYLLGRRGVEVDLGAANQLDPCFLMRQMELRESLSEVRELSDPGAALEQARAVLAEVRSEMEEMQQVMARQFQTGTQDALRKAARLVQEMQFMSKLGDEARELEAGLVAA